jgi:hypothetical protein
MRSLVTVLFVITLLLLTCSDKKPSGPTVIEDRTPPARITSVWICDSKPTWADLCWYAVGDDSLTGKATSYDIRLSQTPIAESNFDSCVAVTQSLEPRDPKIGERLRITELDSGVVYFVAIKASDEADNWSTLSNVFTINEFDTLPPRTITDLSGFLLDDSTYRLQWIAPSDSESTAKVGSYEIKYSLNTIDITNWSSATTLGQFPTPLTPGLTQSVTFAWPVLDTALYFAIRSRDVSGNLSAISNLHLARNPGGTNIIPPDSSIGFETVWTKQCGTYSNQVPASMVATSDNGLVIASGFYDGLSNDIVVMRLDSQGTEMWETRLGGPGREYPDQILSLSGGQFLLVGTTELCADSYADIFFVWIDRNGSVIREHCFGASGAEDVTGAALCADGGIAVVGITAAGLPETSGFILKTDALGNELWRDHYTVFNSCGEAFTRPSAHFLDVAVDANGSLIILGRASYIPYSSGHTGGCDPEVQWIYFKAWSQTGEFLWHTTVAGTDWGDLVYAGTMSLLDDGSIAYTKEQASEGWGSQVCLFRTGGSGGWCDFLPPEAVRSTIRIVPAPILNGAIVAANLPESAYPTANNIGVILLSNLGSQIAAMSFGENGSSETLCALAQMPSKSFAFAWRNPSAVSDRIFVTKILITTIIH